MTIITVGSGRVRDEMLVPWSSVRLDSVLVAFSPVVGGQEVGYYIPLGPGRRRLVLGCVHLYL